ncbi:hypothetical protein V1279_007133 [Bradyrhizobium sp. AZCC 1610]|uniref:TSCPD domain-containing protein n=1 Tax=Bradyrhizobium sp. AZCC 1610 TaxID=3117020 RepID=UPI002FEF9154
MEIDQAAPKPNARQRERHLNRRASETLAYELGGTSFTMTIGFYPDGRVGEVFLNADRANSLLDFLMSDAAILASLALQYGAPLDEIRHALKRDIRGTAASPIGAALDRIAP